MQINPAGAPGRQTVEIYRPGGFTVAGVEYHGSVVVFPDTTEPWSVRSVESLSLDSFDPVRTLPADVRPDVVLVGCGARMQFLDPALKRSLRAEGVVPDMMDTSAACRTYNILLSEERRVAAFLIAL